MATTPIFDILLPTPGADDDAWAPILNDAIIDLEAEVSRVDDATAGIVLDLSGKVAKAGDVMAGFLTLNADPVDPLHAATRQYVLANSTTLPDAPNDGALYGRQSLAWAKGVKLGGDTMTGFLTLHAPPTAPLHAATRGYVDAAITAIPPSGITQGDADVRYVNTTGDTMTGALQLPATDPTGAAEAAHKGYVDAQVATRLTPAAADTAYVNVGGDTMTGNLNFTGTSAINMAGTGGINITGVAATSSGVTYSPWLQLKSDWESCSFQAWHQTGIAAGMSLVIGSTTPKVWNFRNDSTLVTPGSVTIPQGSRFRLSGEAYLEHESGGPLVLYRAPGYYFGRLNDGKWTWVDNGTLIGSLDAAGSFWAKGSLQGTGLYTPNADFGAGPGTGVYIKNYWTGGGNYFTTVTNSSPNWGWCPHYTILVPNVMAMHRFHLGDNFFFEMTNDGKFARSDGYYVSWNPPSDVRMKQNVTPAKVDALALINQIEMVAFDWTDAALEAMAGTDIDHKPVLKPRHVDLGAIAQQVATLKETLTVKTYRSEPREGVPDAPLSVDWGACMPYVLRAIQQLSARIEALEQPA